MEFPSIPELNLADDYFDYRGYRYPYQNVTSIEFGATVTKHSVNFVPTGTSYDARLTVYTTSEGPFEIKPSKGWFGDLKESVFDELQRANAALQFMTFNYRVERYEDQVLQNGMFRMGGYEFYKNGNLSKGGKYIMNLTDGSHSFFLGAFNVTISKKNKSLTEKLKSSWIGESTIYIGKDRDCFIYLMKTLFGLSWANEPVPKKRVDNKRIFYETVVRLGAWMSSVDGNTDPAELAQLKKFFQIDRDSFPNAAKVFNDQLKSPNSPQSILAKFNSVFGDSSELKESLYVGLLSVALADQIFHPAEAQAIVLLGQLLGFGEAELVRLYASIGLDYTSMFQFEGGEKTSSGVSQKDSSRVNQRAHHLKILGLDAEATIHEIRVSYRRLVKQYHPDALRPQGLPENEMKHAERILGQVIESYEWLMQNTQN